MGRFGFIILKTLITELDPDEKVRTSMNEINAAQRQRTAAQELAEADRIKVVTAAKAEAEKAQLTGEGLANQRKAIVNGLTESFEELKNSGLNEEQVLSLLIANQWIDAMDRFAVKGNSAIFLPNDAQGANVMRSQILQGMLSTRAVNLGEDK
jgi:regulator of protease activity HflC (stomatin/prohibitin superfamily)